MIILLMFNRADGYSRYFLIADLIALELQCSGATGLDVHDALEIALECAEARNRLSDALDKAEDAREAAEDAVATWRERYEGEVMSLEAFDVVYRLLLTSQ